MALSRNAKLAIAGGILVVLAIATVVSYNGLVTARESADAQLSQVGVAYARKLDLLGDMQSFATMAMENETAFIAQVTALRSGCGQLGAFDDWSDCSSDMREAGQLMINIVNERYPTLSSIVLVENVQIELVNSVNKISAEQQLYNEDAKAYNTKVQKFPGSLVAGLFGFDTKPYIGTTSTGGSAAGLGTNALG